MPLGGQPGGEPGEKKTPARYWPANWPMLAPMICRLLSSWRTSGQLNATCWSVGALRPPPFSICSRSCWLRRGSSMRFAVAAPPHQGKQNADGANADEQHPPAETVHDPEQQRRKAGQPEILPTVYTAVAFARSCCGNQALTTRLLTGKHGASLMPSPKRHSSSVFSPHRHAVEQGKQRPQGQ